MLLGFQGLVFHLSPCKPSKFSPKVSGDTALGKAALGFDDRIFPLILEFSLFNITAQGNFLLDPLTVFHSADLTSHPVYSLVTSLF